jgi:hypothetical protein
MYTGPPARLVKNITFGSPTLENMVNTFTVPITGTYRVKFFAQAWNFAASISTLYTQVAHTGTMMPPTMFRLLTGTHVLNGSANAQVASRFLAQNNTNGGLLFITNLPASQYSILEGEGFIKMGAGTFSIQVGNQSANSYIYIINAMLTVERIGS